MVAIFAVLMCVATGCGSSPGPELAVVYGVIRLDGEPLTGARVEFNPRQPPRAGRHEPAASGSFAVTDERGYYELEYGVGRVGAVPGEHTVKISTRNANPDALQSWRERVPPAYNVSSQLKFTVSKGTNVADFPLQSSVETFR
jgi:hypothetical protein